MIAEFEKIQFFKFGENFPVEDEKEITCITDIGSEGVFFQINGQTKEVSTDDCSSKKSRSVMDLVKKIRGVVVWNYENGEIPANFEVWYQVRDGKEIRQDFKINAKGQITQTIITNQPFSMSVKKIGKISKKEVKELINEFEKVDFSSLRFSTLSKYDGCLNEPVSNQDKTKNISVTINYNKMSPSLYENCNPKLNTDAAKFEYTAKIIEKLLREAGVKL